LMSETVWQNFISELSSLPPERSSDADLQTLNRIADHLRSSSVSKAMWERLLWLRERRLGDELRMQEKQSFERFVEGRPHLPTLYGNYLFLILLAVSRRFPLLSENQTADLWTSLKSWQLVQLGFRIESQQAKALSPKFDVRAIWANLCKRAKTISQMPQPVQSSVRLGLLLTPSENEYSSCWLFIEDEHEPRSFIGGLWIGQNPVSAGGSIAWCETSHDVIAVNAESMENAIAYDIIAARIHGIDCMWLKEDNEWRLLGAVTIIQRAREAITRIRGIKIDSIESEGLQSLPKGISFPSDLKDRVLSELEAISVIRDQTIPVRCILTTDSDMYVVSFEADGKRINEQRFSQTCDVLRLLRRPLVDGFLLRNSRRPKQFLTWDPYTDIEYDKLQLLKPYVERKTPYVRVESLLPLTCEELMERASQRISLVISHDENLCPVAGGTSGLHGACWRIMQTEKSGTVQSEWLPAGGVTDRDIAGLISSQEVFTEQARYALSIKFSPGTHSRLGIVFRESKMIASALGLRPVPPETFLRMNEERLLHSLARDGHGIQIGLYSNITGERISSGTLIAPEGRWDIEEMIDGFVEDVTESINSYFKKKVSPEKAIVDHEKMLQEMRGILRKIARDRRS